MHNKKYTCVCVCIHIYIYRERERVCVCVAMYRIFLYSPPLPPSLRPSLAPFNKKLVKRRLTRPKIRRLAGLVVVSEVVLAAAPSLQRQAGTRAGGGGGNIRFRAHGFRVIGLGFRVRGV